MISALNKLYRWRYLVAIVMTGLTSLARAGLQPIPGERGRVVLFTMAITFSALNGGFGPGLLATALSLILAAFAIFEPRGLIALADHVADDVYYSPTLRKLIDLPEDR